MRGSRPRAWIKLHVNGMLNGSVRYQLSPAERSVWIDLLLLAATGPRPGLIADNSFRPFPDAFIANRLNISKATLRKTIDHCKQEGRITVTEEGINITNWEAYQSEYDRQKPYRLEKLQSETSSGGEKVTPKVTDSVAESYSPRIDKIRIEKTPVTPTSSPPLPVTGPRVRRSSLALKGNDAVHALQELRKSDDWEKWSAARPGIDLELELDKCAAHWAPKGFKDPLRAWLNWLSKGDEFRLRDGAVRSPAPSDAWPRH